MKHFFSRFDSNSDSLNIVCLSCWTLALNLIPYSCFRSPFWLMNSSRKRQRRQAAALVVQSFITMGKKSTAQPRPKLNIPPRGIGPIEEPNENDVLCGRGACRIRQRIYVYFIRTYNSPRTARLDFSLQQAVESIRMWETSAFVRLFIDTRRNISRQPQRNSKKLTLQKGSSITLETWILLADFSKRMHQMASGTILGMQKRWKRYVRNLMEGHNACESALLLLLATVD